MERTKRERLEARGWKAAAPEELLGMTPEESRFVEIRLRLSRAVQQLRESRRLTQAQLAEKLQSSQTRIAKVEAGDTSVSLDLLIRELLFLGASEEDLAAIVVGGVVEKRPSGLEAAEDR